MSLKSNLTRAFGLGRRGPQPAATLYAAALAQARAPEWYTAAGVPDTLDGRFDALALVLSLVILRLQPLSAHQAEADLTDCFAADMDASLREIGISDLAISKQVGNTVGALGGRLTAYRAALAADDAALADALARNLYRGAPPEASMIAAAMERTRALHARLATRDAAALQDGRL